MKLKTNFNSISDQTHGKNEPIVHGKSAGYKRNKKKMVGNRIYENDSYLRAVVGNYRESGAMQFKKFEFFLISPEDPFGKLFSKTVTIFTSSH